MLFTKKLAQQKRADLRKRLQKGEILQFPGAFNPLSARLIESKGFDGVYVSGAVMSADLCLPDIGLAHVGEFTQRGGQIASVSDLPAIMDMDTGFGEPMALARNLQAIENAGLCGVHIEDQLMPKRCGHLDGKELVPARAMCRRIDAAVRARRDANFLVIARCDARAPEGLEAAIERMRAYVDAGADMVFPEALRDEGEFAQVRAALDVPLLANMTEFGKSPLLSKAQLQDLGYAIVIYPVSLLRLAMQAAEDGLDAIAKDGTQEAIVARMQHRRELYALLRYGDYTSFDASVYNFSLEDKNKN